MHHSIRCNQCSIFKKWYKLDMVSDDILIPRWNSIPPSIRGFYQGNLCNYFSPAATAKSASGWHSPFGSTAVRHGCPTYYTSHNITWIFWKLKSKQHSAEMDPLHWLVIKFLYYLKKTPTAVGPVGRFSGSCNKLSLFTWAKRID